MIRRGSRHSHPAMPMVHLGAAKKTLPAQLAHAGFNRRLAPVRSSSESKATVESALAEPAPQQGPSMTAQVSQCFASRWGLLLLLACFWYPNRQKVALILATTPIVEVLATVFAACGTFFGLLGRMDIWKATEKESFDAVHKAQNVLTASLESLRQDRKDDQKAFTGSLESLHKSGEASLESLHQDRKDDQKALLASLESLRQDRKDDQKAFTGSLESLRKSGEASLESLRQDRKDEQKALLASLESLRQDRKDDQKAFTGSLESLRKNGEASLESLHQDRKDDQKAFTGSLESLRKSGEASLESLHQDRKDDQKALTVSLESLRKSGEASLESLRQDRKDDQKALLASLESLGKGIHGLELLRYADREAWKQDVLASEARQEGRLETRIADMKADSRATTLVCDFRSKSKRIKQRKTNNNSSSAAKPSKPEETLAEKS
ncbi:hypothetical protein Ndes2526B_g05647 [Nannochloris sp. 'desiccata']